MQLPPVQSDEQAQPQSAGMQNPNSAILPQPSSSDNQTPPTSHTQAQPPQKIEENKDLIDKSWVERIKQTANEYRHDPHEQNKKLTVLRAEFLKRQYNRDIKVDKG